MCDVYKNQAFCPLDLPLQFMTLGNQFNYWIIKARGKINYFEQLYVKNLILVINVQNDSPDNWEQTKSIQNRRDLADGTKTTLTFNLTA